MSIIGCDPRKAALQVTPEQAQMVVLEGNIGRYSLVLRQLIKARPLQTRRTVYDDLRPALTASFRCEAGAEFVHCISAYQEGKYEGNDL